MLQKITQICRIFKSMRIMALAEEEFSFVSFPSNPLFSFRAETLNKIEMYQISLSIED